MWLNDREREEYWNMIRKLYHDNDDDVFKSIALFIIVLVWTLAVGRGISS